MASSTPGVSLPQPAQGEEPQFPQFTTFPAEIRRMIWCRSTLQNRPGRLITFAITKAAVELPAVMQVCREARDGALTVLQAFQLGSAAGRTIYVHPAADTFAFVSGCYYTPYRFDELLGELVRIGAQEVAFGTEGLDCLLNKDWQTVKIPLLLLLDQLFSTAFRRILILPPAPTMRTDPANRVIRQVTELEECSKYEWYSKVPVSMYGKRIDNALVKVSQDRGWELEGKICFVLPEKNWQAYRGSTIFEVLEYTGWARWLRDALDHEERRKRAIVDRAGSQLRFMR